MPKGIPVATVAIGNAENAGLLAVRILASRDPELWDMYGFSPMLFACNFSILNDTSVIVCDSNNSTECNLHPGSVLDWSCKC